MTTLKSNFQRRKPRFQDSGGFFSRLSPDTSQRVTYNMLNINTSKNEKNFPVIIGKTGQFAQNAVF